MRRTRGAVLGWDGRGGGGNGYYGDWGGKIPSSRIVVWCFGAALERKLRESSWVEMDGQRCVGARAEWLDGRAGSVSVLLMYSVRFDFPCLMQQDGDTLYGRVR